MSDSANEFEAIQTVHGALEPLDDEARARVVTYIASLLGIDARVVQSRAAFGKNNPDEDSDERDAGGATKQQPTFSTFAELYAAVNPKSNGERALVAGYWLQEYRGVESFASAAAQKELTHLGHKIANITDAMNSMKNQKPMLMLQVKKSGVSRQARKLYKVSHEGVKRIQEMVGE